MNHIIISLNLENNLSREYSFLDLGYSIAIELLAVLIGYNIIDYKKTGRKLSTVISFTISSVFTLCVYAFNHNYFTYFIILLKFSSELCFILVYIYNSELFIT